MFSTSAVADTARKPVIDVRLIAPQQRHSLIFHRFEGLSTGEWFELHSDHEPLPLKQQFQSLWPNQFDWEVLEAGPVQWRVRITRRVDGKACCGCCGGGA